MVNNPDVAAEVLGEPVPTSIIVRDSLTCLVGHHELGLPGKTLTVDGTTVTTGVGGCVTPQTGWGSVSFAGDGSALPSSLCAATKPGKPSCRKPRH
jgi:hypothetical protein